MVIGVGINVNQTAFESNAPNPVSLAQITGKRQIRETLLKSICSTILTLYNALDKEKIREEYAAGLYRKDGFYAFRAAGETFQASIQAVHPDGQLELVTAGGEFRGYYFKEVAFVL